MGFISICSTWEVLINNCYHLAGLLLKGMYEVWGEGCNDDELKASIESYPEELKMPYLAEDTTFKIVVDRFGKVLTFAEQTDRIQSVSYLPFLVHGSFLNMVLYLLFRFVSALSWYWGLSILSTCNLLSILANSGSRVYCAFSSWSSYMCVILCYSSCDMIFTRVWQSLQNVKGNLNCHRELHSHCIWWKHLRELPIFPSSSSLLVCKSEIFLIIN